MACAAGRITSSTAYVSGLAIRIPAAFCICRTAGRWLNGRYYLAYEGLITAAVLYFIIVFAITRVFRWLERRYLRHLERRREPVARNIAPPMGVK